MVKKRWKGLCALWMVLALVIGTFPVAGAVEDVPESAAAAVSEAAGDGERQIPEEAGGMEKSSEDGMSTERVPVATASDALDTSDGSGKEKIPETTALASTALERSKRATLSARAAVTGEVVATSANAWLYVGSGEVQARDMIYSGSDGNGKPGITVQFDKPFNGQSVLNSIQEPQGKKLSGWRLWGLTGSTDSGTVGESPLAELEVNGQISADEYNSLIDGSDPMLFLLIEPLWRDATDIWDGDSLAMSIGDRCNLSGGIWQVDGDTTTYTIDTRGGTVYAARSGTFVFRKKE